MDIGKKIRELRKAHSMTQQELAKALNVQPAAISKYETNLVVPSIDTILAIARVLEVNASELLTEETETSIYNATLEKIQKNEKRIAEIEAYHKKRVLQIYEELNDDGKELLYDLAEFLVTKGKYSSSHE